MKGNRQGFLSRSITRRSGKIAKQYYKKFCNFEGSLAKDPKGLFDKLCRESPKGFPGSFYLFQRRSSHFLP